MTERNDDITRREFIQVGAGVVAIAVSGGRGRAVSAIPDRLFEHGNPLSEFNYPQVEFRPGLHQSQLEQTHAILMGLDEDSLLRPFRMAAGLPAPGVDLGGWYSSADWGPWNLGMWMSALSRYYAITRDRSTKDKVNRLVLAFSRTVESTGSLYRSNKDPGYLLMMITCGLMDAHKFAQTPEALDALSRTMDSALPHLPNKSTGDSSLDKDFIQIPDYQFTAWQFGGGRKHLDLAIRSLDDVVLEALARGENVLPGRQVESHMEALCGAIKAYLILGDRKYLRAVENAFSFIEAQSFATGAYGPNETFLPIPAQDYSDPLTGEKQHDSEIASLGDALHRTSSHFETPCCAYTHFRLTRYLLRITQNPAYGDSMERVMYNTVLGALPLNKYGRAFYQSNYHSHAHKDYFDGYGHIMADEWPCCSGTLPQIAADYRISAYFRDPTGVFVNLYIPSTLRWSQDGVDITLAQTGDYPLADRVTFTVDPSRPAAFTLRLRIPAWTEAPTVRVNGSLVPGVHPGSFAEVHRRWRSGDRVEVKFPRQLDLKAVDDKHPNTVVLVCGPLVLFAVSDDTPKATREQLLAARQLGDGIPEWRAEMNEGILRFAPFWAIKNETYFTYLAV